MKSCSLCSLFSYQVKNSEGKVCIYPFVIRVAQIDDLKYIAEILTLSFHPSEGLLAWLNPLLKLGIYEDLRSRLRSASPHYVCLVACQEIEETAGKRSEILGTVEVSLRCEWLGTAHLAYISNLAVTPKHRRRGIAEKLLQKCEQVAFEWGFEEIFLHVLEDNHSAKQLYLKNGYHIQKIEFTLSSWLFKSPKRLLLNKKLNLSQGTDEKTTASPA